MSEGLDRPILSVIVPARDEAAHLRAAVSSVLSAADRVPGPTEVLVVEGRSTDGTRRIAEDLAASHPNVRIVDNPAQTTPSAFNIGIRASRAPVIAIVSGHSEVSADFLEAGLRRLTAGDADIVGGPIRTIPSRPGMIAWLTAQVVSHPFGVGNSRFRVSRREGYVDAVPFALFNRRVFEVVGLFDEVLVRNQDTEFFGRVRHAGLRVLLDPAVTSSYRARGTLSGLIRQGYANAYWNVLVWRLNPAAFQWRHAIPGAFVSGLLALAAVGFLIPLAWTGMAAVFAVHLGAGGLASLSILRRFGRPAALLLPPVFLAYHLGYGTGSLVGAFAFLDRRPRQPAPPTLSASPSAAGPPAPGIPA